MSPEARAVGFYAAVDAFARGVKSTRDEVEAEVGGPRFAPITDPAPNACGAVALRHAPSLAFPVADLAELDLTGATPTITSTFFGLTGTVSPLPDHLTEGWSQQEESVALHALFDRWHHRLLHLLYCSVRKHSVAHAFCDDGADVWSRRLLQWTPTATSLPTWRRLRAWAVMAGRQAGVGGLHRLLAELLSAHVAPAQVVIEPMTGGFEPLCAEQHLRLGAANAQLGEDAVLGTFVEAPASAFRVRLGPLGEGAYAWLGGDEVSTQLRATLDLFTPPGVRAEVVVLLRSGAHPPQAFFGARLGRDAWLGTPLGPTALPLLLEPKAPAQVEAAVGGSDGAQRDTARCADPNSAGRVRTHAANDVAPGAQPCA